MGEYTTARKKFSSGYQELDALYEKISGLLNENPWRIPFHYSFVPDEVIGDDSKEKTPGTHCMTIGGLFRFERHTSSCVIHTLHRSSSGWVTVDFDSDSFAFAGGTLSAKNRGAVIDSVSPVFWPISSASPQDSLVYFPRVRASLWSVHKEEAREKHPEWFVSSSAQSISAFDRARMVMDLQQDKTLKAFAKNSYKGAIALWWKHFVDREVFSTIVKVLGGSRRVVVDFAAYSAFTRLPDLKKIRQEVVNLGMFRHSVALLPWTQWNSAGLRAHLGKGWTTERLDKVEKLPSSMSLALAPDMAELAKMPGLDLDVLVNQVTRLSVGKLFSRQRAMATRILIDIATNAYQEKCVSDSFLPPGCNDHIEYQAIFDREELPALIQDFVRAWKMAFPDEYFRFNSSDRYRVIQDARLVLRNSPGACLRLPVDVLSSLDIEDEDKQSLLMHLDSLRAAIQKQGLESLLPKRGRGRPRKTVELPDVKAGSAPRL